MLTAVLGPLTTFLAAIPLVAVSANPAVVLPSGEVRVADGRVDTRKVTEAASTGLARAGVDVVDSARQCEDVTCYAQEARDHDESRIARVRVFDEEPHVRVEVALLDQAGVVRSATDALCEICGEAELLELVADTAAIAGNSAPVDSRGVGGLQIGGAPRGAAVWVDGESVGGLPWSGDIPEGRHEVRVVAEGHAPTSFEIHTVEGVVQRLDAKLVLERPRRADRLLVGLDATLLAAGAATVGVGAGLLAMDGRPHDKTCGSGVRDPNDECPNLHETTVGGAVAMGLGAAAVIAGTSLLVVHVRRARKRAPNGSVAFALTGAGLQGRVRF